jgi:hypothetical protein
MMMMMMIFTAGLQKMKLYVSKFTVKNRKIRNNLHWQCAYYSLTFRIVVSAWYQFEYVYGGVESGLQ